MSNKIKNWVYSGLITLVIISITSYFLIFFTAQTLTIIFLLLVLVGLVILVISLCAAVKAIIDNFDPR